MKKMFVGLHGRRYCCRQNDVRIVNLYEAMKSLLTYAFKLNVPIETQVVRCFTLPILNQLLMRVLEENREEAARKSSGNKACSLTRKRRWHPISTIAQLDWRMNRAVTGAVVEQELKVEVSESGKHNIRYIRLPSNQRPGTSAEYMAPQTVFVTGGAGYIGSHCIVELLEAGYNVVAVDNFTNSVCEDGEAPSLKKVETITGKPVIFYQCDLLNKAKLREVFLKHHIDLVIHFAAIKAVGESMQFPVMYYENNIIGTIYLLEVMKEAKCHQLVYSSSCTVYGNPQYLPINENHPTGNITNVYGRTKYFIEEMLKDVSVADKEWNIISLRYFNPVGAHPSGLIGEDPTKAFTNLMPYMAEVAMGDKDCLTIFGGDYKTKDGTGVRDYIHVVDLATGHLAALKKLSNQHVRYKTYNLGTGQGQSVLELITTFEKVTKTKVPYKIVERRLGDIEQIYADVALAKEELLWETKYTITEMCEHFWKWKTMNPVGYRKTASTNGSEEGSNVNGSHHCHQQLLAT